MWKCGNEEEVNRKFFIVKEIRHHYIRHFFMIKNYFKIAWRNLLRNRASSFINVTGLSVGMAVAMLIGLWIWDELSFNKYHQHYNSIAQVMEQDTRNGTVYTSTAVALPLDAAMHKMYGSDFRRMVMSSWNDPHTLAAGDKKISYPGTFIGAEAPEMFTLNMIRGSRNGLKDPSSILISQSVATALFGNDDPMNKIVKLDNDAGFKVSGVYEDLPLNTTLHDVAFMAPWDFFEASGERRSLTDWSDNSLFMYVQAAENADMAKLSAKIKNIKLNSIDPGQARSKPAIFLQPMSRWHLYSAFKNGVNTGGAVQYVWLFGIIGMFVLLLACINFMNLSTARSEKRAKEVGIRKAIGSLRTQLISQFFCESLLIAALAFAFALLLAWLVLPFFDEVANKKISLPWTNPFFWMTGAGFTLFTGFIAGSYPALYLSSFRPVKVLKGTFKAGRFSAVPRKVLVVVQFTVSVVLIIGTIVVFKQVQFGKNRPVGYSRDGLVTIETTNDDLHKQFDAVRADLLKSGAISEVAISSSSTTGLSYTRGDLDWKGKDPAMVADFGNVGVTTEYGKTVGWQFTEGRDFSSQFLTDSAAIVLNEAAVKYMNLKDPVGEIIRVGKRDFSVIGVIKDMVMQSPYEPVKQTIFYIGRGHFDDIIIKINPAASTHEALNKIAAVCKIYSPSVPFSYKFADDEYAKKFAMEERVGKLTNFFAVLAIFISCLGLFGMSSFMAEQRTKEIGVRKILGASVFNLWRLLSKDFVVLVIISLLVATPAAYFFMHGWLQNYQYRTTISWWIFAVSGAGALLITLLTVSFQSVKAALVNPVKSLRTE
jgi:putative ABC transport system permease protein